MLSGRLMKKSNLIKWALFGILSIGSGYILAAYATHYLVFTLGYGVMVGAGVGILYGLPIQIIQTVYDEKQGVFVGLTLAGFGLSTVIVAPILQLFSKILVFNMHSSTLALQQLFIIHIYMDNAT